MQYLFILSLLTLGIGCDRNIESNIENLGKKASVSYCNCIKDNVFNFEYSEELYIYCNKKIASEHELFRMKFEIDSLKKLYGFDLRKLNKHYSSKIESVKIFMKYFEQYSDSCSSLPKQKYPTKF